MKSLKFIPLLAGVSMLCACGKHHPNEIARINASSADAIAMSSAADTAVQSKLVKTADMRFKVKNVQKASEQITAVTKAYNGFIMHHQIQSTENQSQDVKLGDDSVMRITSYGCTGSITVKIPTVKLDSFLNDVSHLGIYVNKRELNISDKSLYYLSAKMKLQNRLSLIAQQKAGKVVIKNPANVLALQDDMVDQQIGNREIDDKVRNSIVELYFYQSNTIYKEIIPDDNPSHYNQPFFKRLITGIQNGWFIFEDVLLGLANLWVFVVAGFGAWVLFRYYRRRKSSFFIKS